MKKLYMIFIFIFTLLLSGCLKISYLYQRDVWVSHVSPSDRSLESMSTILKTHDAYTTFIENEMIPLDMNSLSESLFDEYYIVFVHVRFGFDPSIQAFVIEDMTLKDHKLHVSISYPINYLIEINWVVTHIGIFIKITQRDINHVTHNLEFHEVTY